MSNFRRVANADQNVHFSRAMFSEAEHSRMTASPIHLTTFNAGDLVPIYCREVLPSESLSLDLDFVLRQTTLLTPTMGQMHVDFYAFFVPNRIVNQSWKAVEGENYSGSWTSNPVSLSPLKMSSTGTTQIPVGSVADYYGFPTQAPLPNSVLSLCHDLKFRGYVMIWNEIFRDQNYQPPLPLSTLNVYQGFLDTGNVLLTENSLSTGTVPDGSVGAGSIAESLYGSGSPVNGIGYASLQAVGAGRFRAYNKPLKVNKLHDYFTSVSPSPLKSRSSVFAPATGALNIPAQPVTTVANFDLSSASSPLRWRLSSNGGSPSATSTLVVNNLGGQPLGQTGIGVSTDPSSTSELLFPSNLSTTATQAQLTGIGISVDDLRMAAAIQQVYEIQARGGSRYREIVQSFFGITADDPYSDVPKCLGHISRDLDLYQTAQTSASESGGTPQGFLAGFGYTASGGHLFSTSFLEHGYVHVFAVVRHRNIYSSFMARDNFRLSMLDFYLPPLANISEQPVYAREVNPFAPNPNDPFGYQEAWAEYRYEPDLVSGLMRTGPEGVDWLSVWNYADDFDSSLQICDGSWLRSNSETVLNRSLAATSDISPQFRASFKFLVDKSLPMPTYSVPGLDII